MLNVSNKTYSSTEFKEIKKNLWIKVISRSELKFFIDTFFETPVYTLQIPQNLLRNVFLIWETYSPIKKLLENSSQNKKIYLAKKNFPVPCIRMFILI